MFAPLIRTRGSQGIAIVAIVVYLFSCFEGAAFSLYAQGCVRLRRQDIECPFSYQLLEEIPAEVELGFDERLIH